jgi:hypothetical protein
MANLFLTIFDFCKFKERLGWDSKHTRQTIQKLVKREIRTRRWLCGRHEWFEEETGERNGRKDWLLKNEHRLESSFWDPYNFQSWL